MSAPPDSLQSGFDRAFAGLSQGRESFTPQLTTHEVGTITSVSTGIARISGLPGVGFEELLKFPGDVYGIAFNVDPTKLASSCSANTGILTREMKSGARAGSWTWPWATD